MINIKVISKFLELATKTLSGDWIIIGGTVLPIIGIDHRITVDIDIINLNFSSSNQDSIRLMEIAEKVGLPVESINQAGSYYLSKINDVQEHLVLIKESKKCRIFRPDCYLFIQLKIQRLSESDLADVVLFIKNNKDETKQHFNQILKSVKTHQRNSTQDIYKRIDVLIEALESIK